MKLEPESDTIQDPAEAIIERMKLEGSDNDSDHNLFTAGDEVDMLGDGVPGYETTGEDGTDDEIGQQEDVLQHTSSKLTPHP